MTVSRRLVPPGLALIAVCYGLARFAYGLFLPDMRDAVGLTPTVAGFIGSGSYAGYCLAIIVSMFWVERAGPRRVALAAGSVAALGMALIAVSFSPWVLAIAVVFAGLSTGLASPPMAAVVARMIPQASQPRANTWINSGTSVGVVLSGPVALVAATHWRAGYLCFAVIAVVVTLWLAQSVPKQQTTTGQSSFHTKESTQPGSLFRRNAALLILAATAMGFASAIYWTFAGDAIVSVGGLSADMPGVVWVVIGMSGLVGGAAGDLIRCFGVNRVHRTFLAVLGLATLLLGLFPSSIAVVLISAALFGAAYIMLTGVYLVWGIRVYGDRPAVGLGLPFLMIAIGQVLGAPVAGTLIGLLGYGATFMVFAGVAAASMLAVCRGGKHPRYHGVDAGALRI